jgi:hypothetical protein
MSPQNVTTPNLMSCILHQSTRKALPAQDVVTGASTGAIVSRAALDAPTTKLTADLKSGMSVDMTIAMIAGTMTAEGAGKTIVADDVTMSAAIAVIATGTATKGMATSANADTTIEAGPQRGMTSETTNPRTAVTTHQLGPIDTPTTVDSTNGPEHQNSATETQRNQPQALHAQVLARQSRPETERAAHPENRGSSPAIDAVRRGTFSAIARQPKTETGAPYRSSAATLRGGKIQQTTQAPSQPTSNLSTQVMTQTG